MNIKEFLAPDWKKFILPVIFIVLFIVIISSFYSAGSAMNKYGCQMTSLIQELTLNIERNDTSLIEQNIQDLESLNQKSQDETKFFRDMLPFYYTVKTLDPFIPLPCSTMVGEFCEFYINKETYDCITSNQSSLLSGLFSSPINEYKPVSPITFSINIALLFIEGYLISSIVLFVFRKVRNRPTATTEQLHKLDK